MSNIRVTSRFPCVDDPPIRLTKKNKKNSTTFYYKYYDIVKAMHEIK